MPQKTEVALGSFLSFSTKETESPEPRWLTVLYDMKFHISQWYRKTQFSDPMLGTFLAVPGHYHIEYVSLHTENLRRAWGGCYRRT